MSTSKIENITEIVKPVFRKYEDILFAYLFGTTAAGIDTALSDVDLAIFVKNPAGFSFDDKLAVHADLCRALKRNDLDLVVLNQLRNLILIEDVIRTGLIVWNIDQELVDEFELKMLHAAIDFKHQRQREMGM